MKFKSLRDIFKFAVSKEESAVQFYQNLAMCVKNSQIIAVFVALAQREEGHVENLKLEMVKFGFRVEDDEQDSESEGENEYFELDIQAQEMSSIDALRLGIQKERSAFRLYSELMVLADNGDARKVFFELAEEEMRHVLQLEREIEALSSSRE